MTTNTCEECGETYEVTTFPPSASRWCSRECRRAYKHETLTCDNCGASFTAAKWDVERGRRFCSQSCSCSFGGRHNETVEGLTPADLGILTVHDD